jgi:hypothetical protein
MTDTKMKTTSLFNEIKKWISSEPKEESKPSRMTAYEYQVMLKAKEDRKANTNPKQQSVQEWVTVGNKRFFSRSKWEANYARYLEMLKKNGQITDWQHEPCTFWFNDIQRGVRSYLPDFLVALKNGNHEYHEVKGYMDAKSKTKLARMKKYHPLVKMVLIDKKRYEAIKKTSTRLIKDWQ